MKNFRIFLLIILGFSLINGAKSFFINNANAQALDLEATDAIAVRIIPNPNHYSIARWYESQGFSGAPQSLTVDGYEAVRDGRTVYINATNVDGKNIYTNIYLISYNQSSAAKTVDILGQIVNHWKFNTNPDFVDTTNPNPSCAISNKYCISNTECGTDQICASSGIASSSCILKTTKNCNIDSDCLANFFCNSLKAKIIRDTKRIGLLEELKEALFKYKSNVVNNHFPILGAGTYLPNHSVSSWPSWSQNLLANLGVSGNFQDPINRLGYCAGYDIKTCWNSLANKFVFYPSQNSLMLPAGSYAMVYKTDSSGANYHICATFETRSAPLNFRFSPNDPVDNDCVVDSGIIIAPGVNTAPVLINQILNGEAGAEYDGYLEAYDKENDLLTWTLYTNGVVWKNWVSGGVDNNPPILQDSGTINQKKIFADLAGEPGDYSIGLRIDDGKGGIFSTSTIIKVFNFPPIIDAVDSTYVLSAYNPFSYNFSFSDNNLTSPSTNFSVAKLTGPFDLWDESKTVTIDHIALNKYKVTHSGIVATNYKITKDTDFVYSIKVIDQYGLSTSKNFTIKVVIEKPVIDFNCLLKVRFGKNYSCALGSAISSSRQNIVYSALNTSFASFISKNQSSIYFLSGIFNTPGVTSTAIIATDEYGATSSKPFSLIVNNYCGDGKIEVPNTEGKGGPLNNGSESCDGLDGVTNIVASSSITRQYACSTKPNVTTPDIIDTNDYCGFPSAINGGGFCGDGYCSSVDAGGLETSCNCEKDCGQSINCYPACNYTYSEWGYCQSDNKERRTVKSSVPSPCSGSPILTQDCVFEFVCNTASDCGYGSWNEPWDCQYDRESWGNFDPFICYENTCYDPASQFVRTLYKECGNGWNAKCVKDSKGCVNLCDSDPVNSTDPDCNGCNKFPSDGYNIECVGIEAPYCDSKRQCYTNNIPCTCGSGRRGVTGAGECWINEPYAGASCSTEAYPDSGGVNSCPDGYYQNKYGCSKCPIGTYGYTANHCMPCGPGDYTDTEGATECKPCEPGNYCVYGVKMICPSGTTSGFGSATSTDCIGAGSGE